MFQSAYLRILKEVGLFALQLSGLWPFSYNHQLKRFKFLWYFTILPIIVMVYPLIVIFFWSKYLAKEINIKNTVVKLLSVIFITFNSFNFVIMFVHHYFKFDQIKKLIQSSVQLMNDLHNELDKNDFKYGKHLLKFSVKTFLLMFLLVFTIMQSMTRMAKFEGSFAIYIMSALPNVIMKIYPDVFYGGLIFMNFYFTQINGRISNVVAKAKNLSESQDTDEQKQYQKMKSFCELSDQLDRLCVLQCTIIEIGEIFNRVCAFQVTLWISMGLVVFLVNLFFEYVFISSSLKNGQLSFFNIDLLAVFLTVAEIYFTTTMSGSVIYECRKTGTLLNTLLMRRNMDVRFKKSVEIYSGRILINSLNISGMGLFIIDETLMFSLVSSVTSYLVILIQFELKTW